MSISYQQRKATIAGEVAVVEDFEQRVSRMVAEDYAIIAGFSGVGKSRSAMYVSKLLLDSGQKLVYLLLSRTDHTRRVSLDLPGGIRSSALEISYSADRDDLITLANLFSSFGRLASLAQSVVDKLLGARDVAKSASALTKILGVPTDSLKGFADKAVGFLRDHRDDVGRVMDTSLELVTLFTGLGKVKALYDLVVSHDEWSVLKNVIVVLDDIRDSERAGDFLGTFVDKLVNRKTRALILVTFTKAASFEMFAKDPVGAVIELLGTSHLDMEGRLFVLSPLENPTELELLIRAGADQFIVNGLDLNKVDWRLLYELSGGLPALALTSLVIGQGRAENLPGLRPSTDRVFATFREMIKGDPLNYANYIYGTAIKQYDSLKDRSFAYTAILVQHAGIALDELALFCEFSSRQVNRWYPELMDRYCKGYSIEKLTDLPCTVDKIDASMVVEAYENWSRLTIAPGKDGTRKYLRLSPLFQHLPPLIEQLTVSDNQLRAEVNQVRKTLLRIIFAEAMSEGYENSRMFHAVEQHLLDLDDLRGVESESFELGGDFIKWFPSLGLELWASSKHKFMDALDAASPAAVTRFVGALDWANSTKDKPVFEDIKEIVNRIRERVGDDPRAKGDLCRVLLSVGRAEGQDVTEFLTEVEEIASSAGGDSLSTADAFWDIGMRWLNLGEFDKAKKLLDESNRRLENVDRESIRKEGLDPIHSVQSVKANIIHAFGSLYLRSDSPSDAAKSFDQAALEYYSAKDEGQFFNSMCHRACALFLSLKDHELDALLNIISTEALLQGYDERGRFSELTLSNLASIFASGRFAATLLDVLFGKQVDRMGVENLMTKAFATTPPLRDAVESSMSTVGLLGGLALLDTLNGNFADDAIALFVEAFALAIERYNLPPKFSFIVEMALDISRVGSHGTVHNFWNLSESAEIPVKEAARNLAFTISTYTQQIASGHSEVSWATEAFEKCKLDPILHRAVGTIATIIYLVEMRSPSRTANPFYLLLVNLHLVHGQFSIAEVLSRSIAATSRDPIVRRLFGQLAVCIVDYQKNNTKCQDLILAFAQLWFFHFL